MGKVIAVISMSLDGFITAANQRPDQPLGDGGEQLHDWAMDASDTRNRDILTKGIASIGAVITGRRNYDDSIPWWGADGPTGSVRLPVFVVSHTQPTETIANGVYTFTNGIEAALAGAKAAAGNKDLSVMGGASVIQQFIKADLVDEIVIHLIPVLFSGGTRLFEHLGGKHVQLEPTDVIYTNAATHLTFRVKK